MNTTLLADKRLLITGVVNTDSIAYATATAALAAGAEIALSSLGRDLEAAQLAAESLPGDVEVIEADLTDADHLHRLTDHLDARWGRLDGALHAVAFAPREALAGDFLAAGSAQVSRAFETSTHSYASLASVLATLAPERGGSMVGLDFDAADSKRSTATWPATSALAGSGLTSWPQAPSTPARRAASPTSTGSPTRGRPSHRSPGTPRTAHRWPTPSASCSRTTLG